MDTIVSF